MKLISSATPASDAAQELRTAIEQYLGPTMCFISGGSALDVIRTLNLPPDLKGRTIFMMGDERWSRESDCNNYLTLIHSLGHEANELEIVDTSVQTDETQDEFTNRLNFKISKLISAQPETQLIGLFGIGNDGHTASIFPEESLAEKSFQETYEADSTYVPVTTKSLTIYHRASLTPQTIESLSLVVGYAVSESKKTILESLIHETKPISKMPAQILKSHQNSILVTDQEL